MHTQQLQQVIGGEQALSTINGGPPNQVYSIGEASSAAMYRAGTGKQVVDKRHLMSQGNGVFFDSKAFEKMPSHMHQINSHHDGQMTTLQPQSLDTVTTHHYEDDRRQHQASEAELSQS
jgi:hypothetical protein